MIFMIFEKFVLLILDFFIIFFEKRLAGLSFTKLKFYSLVEILLSGSK